MGKICAICGANSGMYPLCRNCFKLRDNGEIIQCESCKTWYFTNTICVCQKKDEKEENNIVDFFNETNCLLCNEESNGYLFCLSCYNKYKNKTIAIEISNCKEIHLLDETYEGKFICEDGHIVKSKSELAIDNYLYSHGITHAYEKSLPIDANPENNLHPDFYLPEFDMYIEHWGFSGNKQYEKQKAYKIECYKKAQITLISTYENDMKDISASLQQKLKFHTKNKVNL